MKKKQKPYSYFDYVNEMLALPFMIAYERKIEVWEKGSLTLKPRATAREYYTWGTGRSYDEALVYGPQGKKVIVLEDDYGNILPPKVPGKRGRPKGSKNKPKRPPISLRGRPRKK